MRSCHVTELPEPTFSERSATFIFSEAALAICFHRQVWAKSSYTWLLLAGLRIFFRQFSMRGTSFAQHTLGAAFSTIVFFHQGDSAFFPGAFPNSRWGSRIRPKFGDIHFRRKRSRIARVMIGCIIPYVLSLCSL